MTEKKAYEQPTLTEHGSVQAMTGTGFGNPGHGHGPKPPTHSISGS